MIRGRFDIQGPADVPWLLHQARPGSELHLVRTGHPGGGEMTAHSAEPSGPDLGPRGR
jgi:proline iminopeptidase